MSINTLFTKIMKSFEKAGYARAATELQRLSDPQLQALGISRSRLKLGAAGLPWNAAVEPVQTRLSTGFIQHSAMKTPHAVAQNDAEAVRLAA